MSIIADDAIFKVWANIRRNLWYSYYIIPYFQVHRVIHMHDDVIKWKHFPRYWPLCAGNSPVPGDFLAQGQWRGALMLSLICAWINGWVNNREAGDLMRHSAHYNVTVMDWLNAFEGSHRDKYMQSSSNDQMRTDNITCTILTITKLLIISRPFSVP